MSDEDILTLDRVVASVRRGFGVICITVSVFLFLIIAYILLTSPLYTAKTTIFLDQNQADAVSDATSSELRKFEAAEIESQVEIIKSRRVGLQVLEILKNSGYVGFDARDFENPDEKIEEIAKNLSVLRVGETYVISIGYTDTNPERSAVVANAFAQAFIDDQIASLSEASSKSAQWINIKIEELKKKAIEANDKLQAYRQKNNVVSIEGKSLEDQSISGLNMKLGDAKARVEAKKAQYLHSKEIIQKADIDAAIATAFDDDVINNVRNQYLDSSKRYSQLKGMLGANHQAVRNLEYELNDYKALIFKEMARIAKSQLNEYEVAVSEESSLGAALDKDVLSKIGNDKNYIELTTLEKEVETYNTLYKTYLEKYKSITEQQAFPLTETRVITPATVPLSKSHPKIPLLLGVALIIGSGLGILLAIVLDNFDKTLKRAGQVRSTLGLPFLGFLPLFEALKDAPESEHLPKLLSPLCRQSIERPYSTAYETIKASKAAIDLQAGRSQKVIGVISVYPDAGKTTLAANLGLYLSLSHACMLLGLDYRNPAQYLTPTHGHKHSKRDQESSLKYDIEQDDTGLKVIDFYADDDAVLPNISNISKIIEKSRDFCDYIILDLPPLSSSSDVLSLSQYIDTYIIVAEWGKALPNSIDFQLKQHKIDKNKVAGVVLNKADMDKLEKFFGHKRTLPEQSPIWKQVVSNVKAISGQVSS